MPGPKKSGNPFERVLEDPKLMFAALGAMGVVVVAAWAVGIATPSNDSAMARSESGATQWTRSANAELRVKSQPAALQRASRNHTREDSLGLAGTKGSEPAAAAIGQSASAGQTAGAAASTGQGYDKKFDAPSDLPEHEQPAVGEHAVADSIAFVQNRAPGGDALNGFDPSSSNGGFVSTGYGNGAPVGEGGPAQEQMDQATGRTTQVASAAGVPAVRGQAPGRSFLGGNVGTGGRLLPGTNPNRQANTASAGTAGIQSAFMGAGAGGAPAAAAAGGAAQSAFSQAGAAASGGASGFQIPGAGGGGGGSGEGLTSGGGGSSPRPVSPASKHELKAQAKENLDLAGAYRKGAAVPLLNRQRGSAIAQAAAQKVQSLVLGSLITAVNKKAKEFRDIPEAHGLLVDTSEEVTRMKQRLDSARADLAKGASLAAKIPDNCKMVTSVTQKVFVPNPGKFGGRYENQTITTDHRTLSLQGQDLMDAGVRRAKNVGIEAKAGADITGDAFGPVIDGLRAHPDPKQAARAPSLNAIAVRIQNDLDGVAAKLPAEAAKVGSIAGKQTPHASVAAAARAGAANIRSASEKINRRGPGYPEIGAKQKLFRAMTDAQAHADNTLVSVNGMNGSAGDSMDSLHAAGQNATKGYVRLCDSYHNLKSLEKKAK